MAHERELPSAPEPCRQSSGRTRLLLLLVLLGWSLALRLWLGSGHPDPSRFWDERFGLRNIERFLDGGGLRPQNGYYPTLSWLPHALVLGTCELLHETTGIEALRIRDGDGATATAYRICRGMQSCFGAACLLLTFFLGRRLGGERLGLLAAFLLATNPYHIELSAQYKPDALMWLLFLAALHATLRAAERPGLSSHLVAGIAIGAAVSAKYNAAPIALPIAIAGLLELRTQGGRRTLLRVATAAAAALAVVLILQPYLLGDPDLYRRDFGYTVNHYQEKGRLRSDGTHRAVLAHFLTAEPEGVMFGPLVGTLGLCGIALVGYRSLRSRGRPGLEQRGWQLVLAALASYVLVYAATTTLPTHHNWLPVAPIVALAAAAALESLADAAGRRIPLRPRPALAGALGLLAAILLSARAGAYVYREVVPATAELAGFWLRGELGDPNARLIFTEVDLGATEPTARRAPRPALALRDRLEHVPVTELDLADAEVFPARRLEESVAAFYRGRTARTAADASKLFRPRPFRARGEALIAILHPFEAADHTPASWSCEGADPTRCSTAALADLPPGEIVSLTYRAPAGELPGEIESGGERHRAIPYLRLARGAELHLSPRFRAEGSETTLQRTAGAGAGPTRFPLTIWRWRDREEVGAPEAAAAPR